MIQVGCLITLIVLVGLPLLILFLGLLFGGGIGTVIAILAIFLTLGVAVLVTQ
jgi:hypothetical protein